MYLEQMTRKIARKNRREWLEWVVKEVSNNVCCHSLGQGIDWWKFVTKIDSETKFRFPGS
jgi:hypothetical protein